MKSKELTEITISMLLKDPMSQHTYLVLEIENEIASMRNISTGDMIVRSLDELLGENISELGFIYMGKNEY